MTRFATTVKVPTDRLARDDLHGPGSQGFIRAFALALGVHATLIAALTWGVAWRHHSANPTVAAELWAAVPMQEAPAPRPAPMPTPEPEKKPTDQASPAAPVPSKELAPVKPQITVDKAKKPPEAKPEKEKPDGKAKDKKKTDQEKKLADERVKKEEAQLAAVRLQIEKEKARAEAMARMNAMAKNTDKTAGRDLQTTAPSQGYIGRISALIRPNITYAGDRTADVQAQFEVVVDPQGVIRSVVLKKTSGIPAWDDAAYRALIKTERLPLDNGRVYSPLLFAMNPKSFGIGTP